ncbi:MAG TPA: pyrroline-5-carboxylate reductase [Anaeromyxobacteraceae bacterium]|nr:pyrroline-5-carboxylate reductase [Anaeromyxobacteraceae bacterium]
MAPGKKIAFLGTGNMAEAMVKGLLRAGASAKEEIVCAEPRAERRAEISQRYGVAATASNAEAADRGDVIFLTVKPQIMSQVLDEVATVVDPKKLVISIAAGITTQAIAAQLGAGVRIVRAMPNTAALVGAAATAICRGAHATAADLEQARTLFETVGTVDVVDEGLLDAVTGLSGSGPAFLFLVVEALSDGGVKMGLSRDVATQLAAQTLVGAGRLVLETGEHPGRLKDQVTSPGGTTIAGMHALETGGVRGAFIQAVEAATIRSRELGDKAKKT